MRCAFLAALILVVAGCGGGERETLTVYLPARLGPDGPPGQIAPVLSPVDRERRNTLGAAWQSVLALRVGPSPAERVRGVREALVPATGLRAIRVAGGTATVELAGREPGLVGSAAVVYTLTGLAGIDAVRLRLDGRSCCVYHHDGSPVETLDRSSFRGWSGEPCDLRAGDSSHCRS